MDIAELLAFGVKNNASDLHLSAGLPPMIRVDGDIRRINVPALDHKQVHALVYDIMNDKQRKDYEEFLETDFSFEIPNLARFRVNAFNQNRGAGAVFGREVRQQAHHAAQDGQTLSPSGLAIGRAEFQPDAEGFSRVCAGFQQTDDRLGDHQRNIAFQAITQTTPQMFTHISARRDIDPNLAIADFYWKSAYIVGKLVECAAAGEVKAGVMPVTGEDAIMYCAAIQRKAHVWAAVIDGINAVTIGEQHQRMAFDLRSDTGFGADIIEGGGADEGISFGEHK